MIHALLVAILNRYLFMLLRNGFQIISDPSWPIRANQKKLGSWYLRRDHRFRVSRTQKERMPLAKSVVEIENNCQASTSLINPIFCSVLYDTDTRQSFVQDAWVVLQNNSVIKLPLTARNWSTRKTQSSGVQVPRLYPTLIEFLLKLILYT